MLTDSKNEKITLFVIAFLLAGIEKFLPVIPVLPWLKIGLFHAVVMVWIYKFGFLDALAFIFIRQWVFMLFFGFSFLPFLLGTFAAIASVFVGAVLIKSNKFGMIVIGIFCALIHNITQLFVLYVLMNGNFIWRWQLPIITGASLLTGTITGFLAYELNKVSLNFNGKKDIGESGFQNEYNGFGIFAVLFTLVTTCVFENYVFYIVLFLLIIFISQKTDQKVLSVFLFLKRYGIFLLWFYFSFVFSQKTNVYDINFWICPLLHVMKISLWFLLTPFFQKFGFYRLFYKILLKIFPKRCSQTLSIGTIMPQVFPGVLEEIPHLVKSIFKNRKNTVNILVKKSQKILSEWEGA
ncbi:MAG: Gx transporter family protein [Chitinispirillales bacterium]|jgi:heptaprenyl diphosphate synthase|nr:Gx transporter family protein [Chitinispirillales bacterium]